MVASKKEMEEYMNWIVKLLKLIPKEGNSGTVECPKCKGTVHWVRSSYNKHTHAKCETKDCLGFME